MIRHASVFTSETHTIIWKIKKVWKQENLWATKLLFYSMLHFKYPGMRSKEWLTASFKLLSSLKECMPHVIKWCDYCSLTVFGPVCIVSSINMYFSVCIPTYLGTFNLHWNYFFQIVKDERTWFLIWFCFKNTNDVKCNVSKEFILWGSGEKKGYRIPRAASPNKTSMHSLVIPPIMASPLCISLAIEFQQFTSLVSRLGW